MLFADLGADVITVESRGCQRDIVASALAQRHQLTHVGEALFLRVVEKGR
jgi:crotonobetainyl-CoA:carnitine CoA-transferase CaiB-like acyl-CoA transferase